MKRQVPADTIGVSLDSRENLRRASEHLTVLEIPGYKLIREIGRGTFGAVWKAEREQTGQLVALKIVDQGESLNWDYFRRELEFLRVIEEHPHTLTILDAQLDHNPPYIVMPLAEGGSLEQVMEEAAPEVKRVEKWMWQLAEALTFVHSKGVIHCDLKPSNVLLSSGGDVRIADLGQARRVGHGVALGTIGFMAPEQGEEKTRSSPSVSWDVYGFGATAYWLLTGKIPRMAGLQNPDLEQYLEAIRSNPLEPVCRLNPQVDAQLGAIVEGCLALDSEARTSSLDAVLTDMLRRRRNEPLLCRKPWTARYLVGMALRRRGVQLALGLLLLVVLALGAAWANRNENRFYTLLTNGIHAHESGRLEEAYLNWLEALRYRPSRSLLQRLQFRSLSRLYPHQDRVTDFVLTTEGALITASADGEVAFWDASEGKKVASFLHPAHVSGLLLSPDGRTLATASWDGKARTLDMKTQVLKKEFDHRTTEFEPSITALAFCDQGKLLATADVQAEVKVWDLESGAEKPLKNFQPNLEVRQVLATHPSQPILATLTAPNTIGLWRMDSGEKLPFVLSHGAEINELKFSADGAQLMSASNDHTLSVWSVQTGERVHHLDHDSRVNTMVLVSDRQLVSGCQDGTATLWDLTSEQAEHVFLHRRPVTSLALDDTHRLLAVGTGEVESLWSDVEANGTVEVWDLTTGVQVAGPWSHDGPVEKVEFRGESTVYSGSGSARQNTAVYPGAVRAWNYFLPTSRPTQAAVQAERAWPNGVVLDNGVQLSHGKNVRINAFDSHEGRGLTATASEDRTVRLWETQSGLEASRPLLLNGPARVVTFHPSGEILASVSQESSSNAVIRLWEVDSGYPTTPPFVCPGEVRKLHFSPDGKTLSAFTEETEYIWSLEVKEAGKLARELRERLHAGLDSRGEAVSRPISSETVMTLQLP
ncbi:MAG: protein kinase [Vulcanimicrobiota bacterium]